LRPEKIFMTSLRTKNSMTVSFPMTIVMSRTPVLSLAANRFQGTGSVVVSAVAGNAGRNLNNRELENLLPGRRKKLPSVSPRSLSLKRKDGRNDERRDGTTAVKIEDLQILEVTV
jgi:hypothetical protein